MRLVSYDRRGTRRLAAWVGDVVVDLPDAVGHPAFPGTLEKLVARNGGTTLEAARAALEYPDALTEFSVPRARMLAPLALSQDQPMQPLEPGEVVPAPPKGMELVCRPELACIVGLAGVDMSDEEATAALFGYTLVNGWHLRRPGEEDLIPIGTSVGPCVATADEFDPARRSFAVTIQGKTVREARLGTGVGRRFARSIAKASRKGGVRPGEMYGLSPFPAPIPIPIPRRSKAERAEIIIALEVPGIGRLQNAVNR
jgi:hypothetical protein